ncbi:IgG receptor FcRn large subunit p51 isoform X2 [Ornithorhynchus anatinus]|uniref:IgG receptor FcRn large subunit p51 n=1 Tax=Ornithorhynchus anatinus TaxID=9258 RepID=A0A6I8NIU2_ORNAN|nr:IgG receptor FcRn large subunit p51 isoform X2 [Ornithorhynchus anatinus]
MAGPLAPRGPARSPCLLLLFFLLLLFLLRLPLALGSAALWSLHYHFTALSQPGPGLPRFWASGFLGEELVVTFKAAGTGGQEGQAEAQGPWKFELLPPWAWEQETTDLRSRHAEMEKALAAIVEQAGPGIGSHTLQGLVSCALRKDNRTEGVSRFGLDGRDLLTLDHLTTPEATWVGAGPAADSVRKAWGSQQAEKEVGFLQVTCLKRLQNHLKTGRGNLAWTEAPTVRKSTRRSPGQNTTLLCRAFTFHPPDLRLSWLRDGAVLPGETRAQAPLPSGDGTFQTWEVLKVPEGEEWRYACRVEHQGLAQPVILTWEQRGPSPAWLFAASVLILAAGAAGYLVWRRRKLGPPALWLRLRGEDTGSLLPDPATSDSDVPSAAI